MEKIAIIKLGALGDVVRTLPILTGIKEKYPNSEITWITKPDSKQIVAQNPLISKTFTIPLKNLNEFDILYNFDIDEEATNLAKEIKAKIKKGFYSEEGFLSAFNPTAEYYINTIFDDELKKSNLKTYQQMMFEASELPYKQQPIVINLSEKETAYAKEFLTKNKINQKKLIGIHMGASSRWPSKKWHIDNLKDFIKKSSEQGYEILLFGGPNELNDILPLFKELNSKGIKIYAQDPNNSILEFASLVNLCKYIVCADSLALHISLALKKPTIGLFFVTSHSEVEGYGLLKKLIAPKHSEFFPEKSNQYSEELVKSISAEDVLKAIQYFENNKQ